MHFEELQATPEVISYVFVILTIYSTSVSKQEGETRTIALWLKQYPPGKVGSLGECQKLFIES